jgi:hypothetical protein
METEIFLPREHDSFSQFAINGEQLLIRFSYNDTFDYWTFGIYELNRVPIVAGMKIVPNFPLNIFLPVRRFAGVYFMVASQLQRVGRTDFWGGNAKFLVVTA